MSVTSLPRVQKAIFARLTDAQRARTLLSKVTGVFDAVPDNQPYPYLVIGDATETPDRTMGQNGHLAMAFITAYTRDGEAVAKRGGAAGYLVGLDIISDALELVCDEDNPLEVAGHDVVDVAVDSIDTDRTDKERSILAQIHLWLEDAP